MDELEVDAAGPVWSNILYIFEPSSLLLIGDLNRICRKYHTENLPLETPRLSLYVISTAISSHAMQALLLEQ